MLAVGQRRDAMEGQPRRPAPDRYIAMLQPKPFWLVAALDAAEQEDRGKPKGDRDDRRAKIVLVPVLMQGHPRAGLVAVDQAGTRRKPANPSLRCRPPGQFAKTCRHRRPWLSGLGI